MYDFAWQSNALNFHYFLFMSISKELTDSVKHFSRALFYKAKLCLYDLTERGASIYMYTYIQIVFVRFDRETDMYTFITRL